MKFKTAVAADKNYSILHCLPFQYVQLEEVAPAIQRPMWFQLYVLRDRGFMKMPWNVLKRQAVQPWYLPWICLFRGARYRDAHSGMSGPNAAMRRYMQSCFHPHWAWNVGTMGRPHDLGNISKYLGKPTGPRRLYWLVRF